MKARRESGEGLWQTWCGDGGEACGKSRRKKATLLHRRRGETKIPRGARKARCPPCSRAPSRPFGRGSGGSVRTGRGTRQAERRVGPGGGSAQGGAGGRAGPSRGAVSGRSRGGAAGTPLQRDHCSPTRPTRQVPLPRDLFQDPVADPVLLSQQRFLRNARGWRRGAAPGPSGCTAEHLRVFKDDEDSADLLMWAAGQIANAALPPPVLAGIRLGRIVALQKPDGGVCHE